MKGEYQQGYYDGLFNRVDFCFEKFLKSILGNEFMYQLIEYINQNCASYIHVWSGTSQRFLENCGGGQIDS